MPKAYQTFQKMTALFFYNVLALIHLLEIRPYRIAQIATTGAKSISQCTGKKTA